MCLVLQLVSRIINRKRNRTLHRIKLVVSVGSVRQGVSQESRKMESSTPYGFGQNDSLYDYEEALCSNGFQAEYRHVAVPIILSIVIVISLIGNILVVGLCVFCMNFPSLTNIFILNLALSDLLFTVGLVFWVCEFFWGWTFGNSACYIAVLLLSIGYYSSMAFLVLMSVQRYAALERPTSGWKKGHFLRFVLIFTWLVSILAALPATVYSEVISDSESLVLYCTYSHVSVFVAVTYIEDIVFVGALLVMGFCYIRILQTIFKSPRNQTHRTTVLAFILGATYCMFWAPYNIGNFLHNLIYHEITSVTQCESDRLDYASYVCQLLAFTRCCLNPVIYGVTGVKFHRTVREVFQRRANLNFALRNMVDHHSDSCAN